MNLLDPSRLALRGEFQERLLRSVRHLLELNTDEMRMEFTHPSDFWHWGADYMGRWISAMSLLGQYTGEDYGVREVVEELIAFQKGDGSFGPYTDPHDFQEWFGMSRGLVGLLEYFQASHDPQAFEAAIRLGDYYTENYPDCDACMYECYSTALEGLVLLYRLIGAGRYMLTARRMAETSAVFTGVRYSQEVADSGRRTPIAGQVHCQLSTARGLLDLYELTSEERYLVPVLELHDYISNELLWVSGGIGFYYFRPEENETCADADWFRLNLQLWRLTGKEKYMQLAERILLNQLFFDQLDNGGFCYLRGLQNRAGAVFDACCSHHGPRAFIDALRYAFSTDLDTVWINLFVDGDARLELESGVLQISTSTSYDLEWMHYAVQIRDAPAKAVVFKVRMPEWASRARLTINHTAVDYPLEQGYIHLEQGWKAGDRFELSFSMQVRTQRGPVLGQHLLSQDEVAVFFGPWLFCLNDADNPSVRLHLVRLGGEGSLPDAFKVIAPDRLEAAGATPDRPVERLVLSPLSAIGGTPSGAGRIHTVRSPYYKVWIPVRVPVRVPVRDH